MTRLRSDYIVLVATLVLAGVYFFATERLPTLQVGDPLGPKAFPRLLVIGLLIAAALLFVEIRRGVAAARREDAEASQEKPDWPLLAAIVVATAIYFAMIEPIGYVLATAAYLLALTAYFNPGRWVTNAASAVGFSLLSYLAFEYLGVSLPAGPLPI
jgi:putative tricarboxylic transport membrane protein